MSQELAECSLHTRSGLPYIRAAISPTQKQRPSRAHIVRVSLLPRAFSPVRAFFFGVFTHFQRRNPARHRSVAYAKKAAVGRYLATPHFSRCRTESQHHRQPVRQSDRKNTNSLGRHTHRCIPRVGWCLKRNQREETPPVKETAVSVW